MKKFLDDAPWSVGVLAFIPTFTLASLSKIFLGSSVNWLLTFILCACCGLAMMSVHWPNTDKENTEESK